MNKLNKKNAVAVESVSPNNTKRKYGSDKD
jgi:hypothetical protein